MLWCPLTQRTNNIRIVRACSFLQINRVSVNEPKKLHFNHKQEFLNLTSAKKLGFTTNRKMSLTLYKKDESPPARAVMLLIDLLGIKDVQMEDLNPVARDQDEPQYVKMNPQRTIPIIQDGDFGLGDSHAIMIYLMDKYGKPEHSYLYPKDHKKRAIINHRLFLDCGILFPRLRAVMAPAYFGRLTELSKHMIGNMEDAYSMLEECLSQAKFIAEDVLTIADLSIFTTMQSLNILHPVDDKRYPKLRKWLKTMTELDVVKRSGIDGEVHGRTLLMFIKVNKDNQEKKKSKL